MVGNGFGGVADDAEWHIVDRAIAQHTQVSVTGYLAAGVGVVADAAGGAVDVGGVQLQCAAAGQRGQCETIAASVLQGVTAAPEQPGKARFGAVAALQARAAAVVEQRGVERQGHPGHRRELGQHIAQRTGGDVVAADAGARRGVCGQGVVGRHQGQGDGQAQRLHGNTWRADAGGGRQHSVLLSKPGKVRIHFHTERARKRYQPRHDFFADQAGSTATQ